LFMYPPSTSSPSPFSYSGGSSPTIVIDARTRRHSCPRRCTLGAPCASFSFSFSFGVSFSFGFSVSFKVEKPISSTPQVAAQVGARSGRPATGVQQACNRHSELQRGEAYLYHASAHEAPHGRAGARSGRSASVPVSGLRNRCQGAGLLYCGSICLLHTHQRQVRRHAEERQPQVLDELRARAKRGAHRCVEPASGEDGEQREGEVGEQVVHAAHGRRVVADLSGEKGEGRRAGQGEGKGRSEGRQAGRQRENTERRGRARSASKCCMLPTADA
jgi:hypothetical protein